MTKHKLLKKLLNRFDKMEFCTWISDGFLYVHHMSCTIYFENKDDISISFEMNCEATVAAVITQQVIDFADTHYLNVLVYEPYALVIAEDESIHEVLFGDEAREYFVTGEMPETKSDQKKSPVSIEDLKADLKVAIERQDYESASKFRDKINKLEKSK